MSTIRRLLVEEEIEIYNSKGIPGIKEYIQEKQKKLDKVDLFKEFYEALKRSRILDKKYSEELSKRISVQFSESLRLTGIENKIFEIENGLPPGSIMVGREQSYGELAA